MVGVDVDGVRGEHGWYGDESVKAEVLVTVQGHSLHGKKDYSEVSSMPQEDHPLMHHIFRLLLNHIENMWEYKDILFSSSVTNTFDRV